MQFLSFEDKFFIKFIQKKTPISIWILSLFKYSKWT